MKICVNGVCRDMTPEEEAAFHNEGDLPPETALEILLGEGIAE